MIGDVMFPLSRVGGGGGGSHYMGTVAQASDLPSSANDGDYYVSIGSFTLSGESVQPGDQIVWNGNTSSWDVIPTSTGTVVGPPSSVDGNIAVFDGTTGGAIKDSGLSPMIFITYDNAQQIQQGE